MPTPMAANTVSACHTGSAIAKPSDAPMKGAVHGEATATASTPDKPAFTVGWRLCNEARRLGSICPNSKTPAKLRPSTVNNSARAATTGGDCS